MSDWGISILHVPFTFHDLCLWIVWLQIQSVHTNLRLSGQSLTYFQVFSALGVVLLPDDRGPPLPNRVPRDLSAIEQLVWTERTVWISERGKKTFELHFTEILMNFCWSADIWSFDEVSPKAKHYSSIASSNLANVVVIMLISHALSVSSVC